tara:strand:+ start:1041 stop:2789 length:1749 start_codon:yes stop_codon:yes gene_type:complete
MGCIFFEGFNYSDSDYTTLDPTYWSGVNTDYGLYQFKKGRTNNAHIIPSRSAETATLNSASLMLSGFPAISDSESYYGMGCFISHIQTNTSGNGSLAPYREKLLSFYNGTQLIFDINTTWMANSGLAIEVSGNGNGHSVEVPLFYAPLPEGKQNDRRHFMQQRTYTVDSENDRKTWRLFTPSNSIITNKTVTDLCGQERLEVVTSSSIYLEIFGKANDGFPATTGTMHINVDSSGITPTTGISITGFNNLDRVEFHGTHHASGECDPDSRGYGYSKYETFQNEYRIVDDVYLASGATASEVNLGASVRIFRLTPNQVFKNAMWSRNQNLNNIATGILSSNDNQTWIGANISGAISINGYDNINTRNTIIDGIKVINIDQSDFGTKKYNNVMVSGGDPNDWNWQGGKYGPFVSLGPNRSVSSRNFQQNSHFSFTNPTTNTNWTKTDINRLKMGVVAGTLTTECEDSGGYIIQEAGSDQTNGIYCEQSSGGASIQSNFLKIYFNTKDNGYYIAYDNTGDSNAGWYVYDGSDNKIYKNNVVAGTKAPMLNWSLSDYGIYPPPDTTLALNKPEYGDTSPQNLDYIP